MRFDIDIETAFIQLAEAIAAEEVPWQDERLQVSVAYGAHVLSGGQQADDALDAADRAMYANKRDSRQQT